jgi:hypothetical protein
MIHSHVSILPCHMNARFSFTADMAVVDIEVIKARTGVPSETTGTCDGFRNKLLQRDICCVFTGIEARLEMVYISSHSSGVLRYVLHSCIDGHLIGSLSSRLFQWFRLIVQNRPHEDNDYVGGLENINDVRNGIFATSTLHRSLTHENLSFSKFVQTYYSPNLSEHIYRHLTVFLTSMTYLRVQIVHQDRSTRCRVS